MLQKNKLLFLSALSLFFSLIILFPFSANAESIDALFHHNSDPVAGNPRGNVTVVEFFDYQCSHCVSMAPVIQSIIQNNPNVRIVFKEFPIRGPMSEFASHAALAANIQGKYYPFSHALLESSGSLSPDTIMSIAKRLGMNVGQLKKDMYASRVKSDLQFNYRLARELELSGTPAFYVGPSNATSSSNVQFLLGELSQSQLQSAISSAAR